MKCLYMQSQAAEAFIRPLSAQVHKLIEGKVEKVHRNCRDCNQDSAIYDDELILQQDSKPLSCTGHFDHRKLEFKHNGIQSVMSILFEICFTELEHFSCNAGNLCPLWNKCNEGHRTDLTTFERLLRSVCLCDCLSYRARNFERFQKLSNFSYSLNRAFVKLNESPCPLQLLPMSLHLYMESWSVHRRQMVSTAKENHLICQQDTTDAY